jgi:hypothetical protein
VTKKFAGKGCSGWRMAGGIFLTMTRGDGDRLSDQRGVGTVGRRGPWDETMEPDWFAKPIPPRTSGFFLLTGQAFTAHARVLQKHGRHTRVASCRIAALGCISCAVPILLSHHWPSTCLRVVGCLAYALVCSPCRLTAAARRPARALAHPSRAPPLRPSPARRLSCYR